MQLESRESITVALAVVKVWAQSCVPAGASAAALLEKAGIHEREGSDPEARVGLSCAEKLWDVLAEYTGEDCAGLRCASRVDIEVYGAFGVAVRASTTVREAVEATNRQLRLVHDVAQMRLVVAEKQSRLIYEYVGTESVPHLQAAALMLVGTVELFRRLIIGKWSPVSVHFEATSPRDARPYEEVLRVPVLFEAGENCVVFDSATLDQPLISGDPALSAMYRAQAEEQLEKRRQQLGVNDVGGLLDRVRSELTRSLPNGDGLDLIARRMGMSARTLQRRLRAAGVPFQLLLDRTRQEKTLALLKTRTDLESISKLVGYTDSTAFRRAFKRWTDQTPGEFLRQRS